MHKLFKFHLPRLPIIICHCLLWLLMLHLTSTLLLLLLCIGIWIILWLCWHWWRGIYSDLRGSSRLLLLLKETTFWRNLKWIYDWSDDICTLHSHKEVCTALSWWKTNIVFLFGKEITKSTSIIPKILFLTFRWWITFLRFIMWWWAALMTGSLEVLLNIDSLQS